MTQQPKQIAVTFTSATNGDPVTFTHVETGNTEIVTYSGGAMVDMNNLAPDEWDVGDTVIVSIGGARAGTTIVTLTSQAAGTQEVNVTTGARSSNTIEI